MYPYELYIEVRSPKYGPEWGSGGVFGLKYCNHILYYTLAFEAEAHFISPASKLIYRFEHLGPGPASGGDTYNAVDCSDDFIYFGGWVHNPSIFKGKSGFEGEIDFRNKYSHVHSYDISRGVISLIWSESIHDEYKWAGEVSEIIYNPILGDLLLARADGHVNLGIYRLNPKSSKLDIISSIPGLKGSIFLDYACFDIQPDWVRGIDGVQCFDLSTLKQYKFMIEDWSKISVDGGAVEYRGSGYAISAYTRYYHFIRGGVLVGNPLEPKLDGVWFIRLLDFGNTIYSQLSPQRSNAVIAGGGVLAPFNAYTHGVLHIDYSQGIIRDINDTRGPSILVYITPPQARIVGVYGARITSATKMGSKILLGYNTAPNLGGRDATPIDIGYKGILVVDEDTILNRSSPPVTFRFRGRIVGDSTFGGIPLTGYKNKSLIIKSYKSNTIEVYDYDSGLPPELLSVERYSIGEGKNIIDLGGFVNIASFRLKNIDEDSLIYVSLS
ncbi:MAG: DUF2139 domain-containing protein [Acidilobaceae archaeon]